MPDDALHSWAELRMKVRKGSYWVTCPGHHDERCTPVWCALCANTGKVQGGLAAQLVSTDWAAWAAWAKACRN